MDVIYKVDSRKRTYGELWRIHRPRVHRFLEAAVGKLLGVPQPYRFGLRWPDTLSLHHIEDLPRVVPERVAATVLACGEAGFEFQFFASVDALVGAPVKTYLAAMLRADGSAWATAVVAVVGATGRPALLSCFSRLPDGKHVVTSDHVWKLNPHPDDLPGYVPGGTAGTVVAAHLDRIDDLRPVRVRADELAAVILGREQRHVEYGIERGVYVPMTEEEAERLVWGETNG